MKRKPTTIEKLSFILEYFDASEALDISPSFAGKNELVMLATGSGVKFTNMENIQSFEILFFDHKFAHGLFGSVETCFRCGQQCHDAREYPAGKFVCLDCGSQGMNGPAFAYHLIQLALMPRFEERVGYIYKQITGGLHDQSSNDIEQRPS